jgi:hypothetical protein
MPETDIINPWPPSNQMNPNYGYARKRPITHLATKARSGAPYYRELTDVGHSFSLTWQDRPFAVAQALKRYYEQYRDGFFSYVDWEDIMPGAAPMAYGAGAPNARAYTGRFTSPVEPVPTQFGHWNVTGVEFDEIPNVPMINYPCDWEYDAVWRFITDDFGSVIWATDGTWNFGGTYAGLTGTLPPVTTFPHYLYSTNLNATDWASIEYVGYGFELAGVTNNASGIASISVDGGAPADVSFYASVGAPAIVVSSAYLGLNLSLGSHIVTIQNTNTKYSGSGGYGYSLLGLLVMR